MSTVVGDALKVLAQAFAHLWYWDNEYTARRVSFYVYEDQIGATLPGQRIRITIEFEPLPGLTRKVKS